MKLVEPKIEYKQQLIQYVNEFIEEDEKYNEEVIPGTSRLFNYINDIEGWITKCSEMKTLSTDKLVPATLYLLVDENDEIVGIFNVRHDLNDYLLQMGGHIGYSVRQSKRRMGYAKLGLSMCLDKCIELGMDRVLVTCDDDNIGSLKTIESCGGVLENIVEDSDNPGVYKRRYWITF